MSDTAAPTILKSPDISQAASQVSKDPKGFFKKNLFKIVIAILVVGVIVELYLGGTSLFSPNKTNNLNILQPKVNEMSNARLSLIPDKSSYKPGETVVVDVKLYTGGYSTASTDLALKYDPAFLRPVSQNFVSVGQIYPDYPPVQVEEKQGLVGISGIPLKSDQAFSGVGMFARLNFTAVKEGQTDLMIDFTPGSTADSNVVLVSETRDVLGGVDNARINISASAQAQAAAEKQSCGSFTQSCQNSSGVSGTQVCNAGTINNGVCGYDPKITLSCEECKAQ